MTACSLDPQWLGHPCDTAMGVLISPAVSRATLYLNFGSAPTDKPDAEDKLQTINVVKTVCLDGSLVESTRTPISHASTFGLPAGDAAIDLAVLSSHIPIAQWGQVLNVLIQEIRRVLKPGGELLIVYEPNGGDRRVKKKLMRRLQGHVRMLRNALRPVDRCRIASALYGNGLTHAEWFVPWRDQGGCLTTIQPIENRWLPARDWRQKFKAMAAKETIARASASPLQPSLLQTCTRETSINIARESRAPKTAHIGALLVTPKEKVVAMANVNGADVVIRIPLSGQALRACKHNMRALKRLQADASSACVAPRPLFEASLHGQYFSAESRIDGGPLVNLPPAKRRLELVETLIKTLNPTSRIIRRRLESTNYDELVGTPLAAVLSRVTRTNDRVVLARYFSVALHGMPYAAGVSQGDFSLSNIFIYDQKISGVIDWDEGAMNGLPVLDAISHLCSRQGHRSGNFSDTFCRLATRQWPESAELAFLDRCYEHFSVDPGQHFALVMLYWLQIVGSQSQFWFSHNTDFSRTHVDDIVRLISQRISVA